MINQEIIIDRIILYVALITVFAACNNKDEVIIADVSKDTTVHIQTNSIQPGMLRLHVTGDVDSEFMINHVVLGSGKIDMPLAFDWYLPEIVFRFKSLDAKKGNLVIKYYLP